MCKKLFKLMSIATCMLLISSTSFATIHQVWVGDGANTFDPQTFTAFVGDTVEWNWAAGGFNVESTTIPSGAASWNSGVQSDPYHYIYVIKEPGTYNYKDASHPGMTGSFTAAFKTAVGSVSKWPFLISPMPAGDRVSFTGNMRALQVEVYDLNGRKMTTWTATGLSERSFSVAEFPNGMYLLSITADDKWYNEKLVVTH